MLSATIVVVAFLYCVLRFLVLPLAQYLADPKGLRRYPSFSPLAGVFDLPYCLLSWRGNRSQWLTEAHKTHPVLRIGPNSLSFGDVKSIRDIYGHGTRCTKDIKYDLTAGDHPHLFDVTDKTKHGEKRKRLAAAFATKNLERWEHKVARTTERLIKSLDNYCSPSLCSENGTWNQDEAVDLNHYLYLFTIEAINYLALSSDLGLLEQGHDEVTAQRMDGTTYRANYRKSQASNSYAVSHFVWDYKNFHLYVLLSKLLGRWRKVWTDASHWSDITYHQAVTRLRRYQNGEKLDDFFSALMDDRSGSPLYLEWGEIVSEVSGIIDAGADTTANAITQVMDFLMKNPQHLKTLREEVDSVLSPEDVVAPHEAVKNLPFLRACLDEGLRLSPPTSAGLPRRTPTEGTQIGNDWIAGDTTVSMTIHTAHHDATIFPNPKEFNPHRWMNPEERRRMESFFIPFSAGGRGCLGRNISYLEQSVVVASLVYRYEFAQPRPDWKLPIFEAFNLQLGRMPVKIWKRQLD